MPKTKKDKAVRRCQSDLKLKLTKLFQDFHLEKIRIKSSIVDLEISHQSSNRDAAWDLYVEMLTRIVTQRLPYESGDEKAALDSVYTLFPTTREILRKYGRDVLEFSKVAVPILNQVVRPFTTKWHKESQSGAFNKKAKRLEFRKDLDLLLVDLRNYNRMLATIAGVEDLTDMESVGDE